ncbi:hypothetical protein MTP02_00210 [Streptomyces albus]|nr:hypothetical protein MTP02_00210 [Streptomyces albus]
MVLKVFPFGEMAPGRRPVRGPGGPASVGQGVRPSGRAVGQQAAGDGRRVGVGVQVEVAAGEQGPVEAAGRLQGPQVKALGDDDRIVDGAEGEDRHAGPGEGPLVALHRLQVGADGAQGGLDQLRPGHELRGHPADLRQVLQQLGVTAEVGEGRQARKAGRLAGGDGEQVGGEALLFHGAGQFVAEDAAEAVADHRVGQRVAFREFAAECLDERLDGGEGRLAQARPAAR